MDARRAVMRVLDVAFPLADTVLIFNGLSVVYKIGYRFLIQREGHVIYGALYIFAAFSLLLTSLASLLSLRFHEHPRIPSRPPKLQSEVMSFKTSGCERRILSDNSAAGVRAWVLNVAAVMESLQTPSDEIHFNTCHKGLCKPLSNWKPPRTHHCSSCGACRVGFDHHCPWIGTCLTMNLLPRFALFLTCIALIPAISLMPLFIIQAPAPLVSPDVPLRTFPSSDPLLLADISRQDQSSKFVFRDTILPSRIYTAYAYSRSSQEIREAWWDRWYSWYLVMGPIGRVPVGVLWGVRELAIEEQRHALTMPGEDIARPGVSLILTSAYGMLFGLFALAMCIVTLRHAQKGITTLEAQFSEGSVIYPRELESNERNETMNFNPVLCVWLAISMNTKGTNSSKWGKKARSDGTEIYTPPGDTISTPRAAEPIFRALYLSPEQMDIIQLYAGNQSTFVGFLREGLRTTLLSFVKPCRGVDAEATNSEGKWGGWEWPKASEVLTDIAIESLNASELSAT
ncbi:hypothetical protein SCHPADRAFT_998778 [Schizopora paradoxa]|uniref:Palmitoyltransferase n=1 Tax=Schizopora paradoxa TaxID=27342 RepID=A0A0H2RQ69_9AGAM|nr:hypothetical protein SCHPADRAFT_998778 [Schizopora paradoxa]